MKDMSSTTTIGKNLKELRTYFGYSQEFIGSFLQVSHTIISRYESGSEKIPLDRLEKLALLFGVDAYDFYEENAHSRTINAALAFRADGVETDMTSILEFKKIVKNYLNMVKMKQNG